MGLIFLFFMTVPIFVILFGENRSGEQSSNETAGRIFVGAIVLGISYWAVGKINLSQAMGDFLAFVIWYICFFIFSAKFNRFVRGLFGSPDKTKDPKNPLDL